MEERLRDNTGDIIANLSDVYNSERIPVSNPLSPPRLQKKHAGSGRKKLPEKKVPKSKRSFSPVGQQAIKDAWPQLRRRNGHRRTNMEY